MPVNINPFPLTRTQPFQVGAGTFGTPLIGDLNNAAAVGDYQTLHVFAAQQGVVHVGLLISWYDQQALSGATLMCTDQVAVAPSASEPLYLEMPIRSPYCRITAGAFPSAGSLNVAVWGSQRSIERMRMLPTGSPILDVNNVTPAGGNTFFTGAISWIGEINVYVMATGPDASVAIEIAEISASNVRQRPLVRWDKGDPALGNGLNSGFSRTAHVGMKGGYLQALVFTSAGTTSVYVHAEPIP